MRSASARLRREVAEAHAFTQLIECRRRIGAAFHLRPINLRYLVPGLRDARLQDAVIGKQQQALAVGIEAAGGINASRVDVIRQGPAARLRAEFAGDTERLVEGDEHSGAVQASARSIRVRRHDCAWHSIGRAAASPFAAAREQARVARTIRARRDQVRRHACSCTVPS